MTEQMEQTDLMDRLHTLWRASQACDVISVAYYTSEMTKALKNYPDAKMRFDTRNGQITPVFDLGQRRDGEA